MGTLKIKRGKQASPARVVVYGTEGIGKSTLASQFPNPLILDTEDGTKHLDCSRVSCTEWKTLTLAMAELAVDSQGFQTVVIDSADWAEKLLTEWLLTTTGKKSIEEFGFGKGYVMLQEHVTRFLASADKLVARGMHVVFVAHSKVVRTSPPDQTDGYDRYELKLTKQVAPLFKEWADLVLFANYKTRLVEGADGRKKASGGKQRVMYAERSAAWDAKNRYGLAEEMPMSIEQLRPIFGQPAIAKATLRERVASATTVAQLGELADLADEMVSKEKLTPEQAKTVHDLIGRRHEEIEPAVVEEATV